MQWHLPVSSPITVAGAAPDLHRLPFSDPKFRVTAPSWIVKDAGLRTLEPAAKSVQRVYPKKLGIDRLHTTKGSAGCPKGCRDTALTGGSW